MRVKASSTCWPGVHLRIVSTNAPGAGMPDSRKHESIAIIDLEYTAWEGSRERRWSGPGEFREIVEIGLIVLRGAMLMEVASMGLFVRPRRNPILSEYFMQLTGIDQAAVDCGLSIEEAGAKVACLLNDAFLPQDGSLWSFGEDGEIFLENFALVGQVSPVATSCFRNIRDPLTTSLGLPPLGVDSSALPAALGLPPLPARHRAIDDCRAVAAALRHARHLGIPI